MDPKFIAGKHKKQTKPEPLFDQTKDLKSVIYQIAADLREKANWELHGTQTSWKDLKTCDVKMSGDTLEIKVNAMDGSLRQPRLHLGELQNKIKQTKVLLDRFETALRKEFKKRTGRALSWKNKKEIADCEMIALNGLHRFYAIRVGQITTELAGNSGFDDE
jgi:hypothetical protein